MEKTTVFTFLYHGTSATAMTKLVDITSYPELFSNPEKIDISDMSHDQKLYEKGMKDLPDYEFGFNYTKAGYDACKALVGQKDHYYELRFGQNGDYGAWRWQGDVFVTPTAGSVGAARTAKLVIYPSTEIQEVSVTAAAASTTSDEN